jgi:hypothetical protein
MQKSKVLIWDPWDPSMKEHQPAPETTYFEEPRRIFDENKNPVTRNLAAERLSNTTHMTISLNQAAPDYFPAHIRPCL